MCIGRRRKMLSKEIYNRVLNYYDEYKKEYTIM